MSKQSFTPKSRTHHTKVDDTAFVTMEEISKAHFPKHNKTGIEGEILVDYGNCVRQVSYQILSDGLKSTFCTTKWPTILSKMMEEDYYVKTKKYNNPPHTDVFVYWNKDAEADHTLKDRQSAI